MSERSNRYPSWVVTCGLLSVHTLLIIATILSICGPAKTPSTATTGDSLPEIANASLYQTTPETQSTTPESLTTTPKIFNGPLSSYLKGRIYITNAVEFKFLQISKQICADDETPFLTIICVTKHYENTKRNSIRNTWGKVVSDGNWPRSKRRFTGIKLIFVLGHPPGHSSKYDTAIKDEGKRYGDIVQADFVDSPFNASTKVLLGLEWVQMFCPKSRFILRVSGDQFVHVANLVTFLESLEIPEKGLIVGSAVQRTVVVRKGRWGVDKTIYPYYNFPPYVFRSSYVISGEIAGTMYSTAQHLPYIFIEDAFISGIVRSAVGASLVNNDGFVRSREPKPKLCGFHNDFRITSNTNPSLTMNLWKSLSRELDNCYSLP